MRDMATLLIYKSAHAPLENLTSLAWVPYSLLANHMNLLNRYLNTGLNNNAHDHIADKVWPSYCITALCFTLHFDFELRCFTTRTTKQHSS